MKLCALSVAIATLSVVDLRFGAAGIGLFFFTLLTVWLTGLGIRKHCQHMQITRHFKGVLQVGQPAELIVEIINTGKTNDHVSFHQPGPPELETEPGTTNDTPPAQTHTRARIAPHAQEAWTFTRTPNQRGRFTMPPMLIEHTDALGLACVRSIHDDQLCELVQPDLSQVRLYDRLRRTRALRALGVHRQRQLGQGREFDQVRDYQKDDDYRDINWKATARTGRPMTNLYQAEKSRDLMICLDGGRLMGDPLTPGSARLDPVSPTAGLSRTQSTTSKTVLDHAVEATSLLMQASADQGDRAGLLTFRDKLDKYHKPQRSAAGRQMMLKTMAEFAPAPVFTNYLTMAHTLRTQLSHRSLVVVLTQLTDPQLADDLAGLLPTLAKRHLVVVVALEDHLVERVAAGTADSSAAINRVLAARRLHDQQLAHRKQIQRAGVQVVTADAEDLSMAVINHYLQVRARQVV